MFKPKKPTARLQPLLDDALGLLEIQISTKGRMNKWERCGVGDVVLYADSNQMMCGRVSLLASGIAEDGSTIVPVGIVEQWEFVSRETRSTVWKKSGNALVVRLENFVQTVVHAFDDDVITVLMPRRFR